MSNHRIAIASPPDRDKLVAMIDYGHEQWAEINHESTDPVVELYPRRDGKPWVFDFNEMMSTLESAKQRLELH
jgi:hypothetical protein